MQGETIYIEGGTVIDGNGGEPVRDAVIIIDGNEIKVVSQKEKVPCPQGAKIINAAGKFILPGFIDMQVHYHTWTTKLFLAHGVTTIYDTGNITQWIIAQKEGIEKGNIFGPRIYCVGPILNGLPAEGPGTIEGYNIGLESTEIARKVVRELAAQGVDGIKLYWNTTIDLLKAVSDEAHKAGLPVLGHIIPSDARELAEAGIDCLLHSSGIGLANIKDPIKRKRFLVETFPRTASGKFPHYLWVSDPSGCPYYLMEPEIFDDTIQFLIKKDIYINPTLVFSWKCVHERQREFDQDVLELSRNRELVYIPRFFFSLWLDYSGCTQLTQEEFQKLQQGYKKLQEFIKRFVKAGGKVLPGSDPVHSGIPGLGLHQEMQLLVAAGLSPMEVIMAATKYSAEFIRKSDQLGTIEEGKLADLVILKDSPLVDIRNAKKIDMVIKDGEVIDNSYRYYENPLPRPFDVSAYQEVDIKPFLQKISPDTIIEGSKTFTLMVHGKNFFRDLTVQFNGINLVTKFVNANQLIAEVPSSLIGNPGVFSITVARPGLSQERSNAGYLVVKFK